MSLVTCFTHGVECFSSSVLLDSDRLFAMIKEVKINSGADVFDSKRCSSITAGDDLMSMLTTLDKCGGQYCVIVDVVESRSYTAYKHKLHQISELLKQLTKRETEVLSLVIKGMHNKAISSSLNISVETVKSHRKKIVSKVGLHKVNDLVNILYEIFVSKNFQEESTILNHPLTVEPKH